MRKLWKKMKNKQGFTLMEMLIVVAIIAVLVAIAIPVYQGQVHEAKVASDWANLRAFYAEIQDDFMSRGGFNPDLPDYGAPTGSANQQLDFETIPFLNGGSVKLKAGYFFLIHGKQNYVDTGYQIIYQCNKFDLKHDLTLGN